MSGEINKKRKSGRGKSKKADIVTETENGFPHLSGIYSIRSGNPLSILAADSI